MRVDLRGSDIVVAEQLMRGVDVVLGLEQVNGKTNLEVPFLLAAADVTGPDQITHLIERFRVRRYLR